MDRPLSLSVCMQPVAGVISEGSSCSDHIPHIYGTLPVVEFITLHFHPPNCYYLKMFFPIVPLLFFTQSAAGSVWGG